MHRPTRSRSTLLLLTVLVAAVGLVAAACGSDDSAESSGGITIEGAWARTSPAMADTGVVYLEITADDDAALVGGTVSDEVAAGVELHETVASDGMADDEMADDGMADDEMADDEMAEDGHSMGGVMSMQPVAAIDLPAGETVVLEPGGLHIMLVELAAPLEEGTEIELTVVFDDGTEVDIDVPVRSEAP